jgi:threonine/homoserine/homoserine lactone efflux protein
MIGWLDYLAYVAACVVVVIVPGPTVTMIIANSLRHGARASLANVAGTQAGLAVMLGVLALGLEAIVASMATLLDSGYALVAGGAGRLLSRSRLIWLERISGSLLIGGGVWLALARRS